MEKVIPLYKCIYTINKNILDLICSIAYKCGKLTTLNMSYPKAILDANETSYLLELTGIKISQSKIRALSRGEKVADPNQADAIYKLLSRLSSFDPNNIVSIDEIKKISHYVLSVRKIKQLGTKKQEDMNAFVHQNVKRKPVKSLRKI